MNNIKPVTKAVIPAAGFGTRFLPQTKAMPKEMLPLVDKPIIQHIVEELVASGIKDIIIVTGYHKRSIEDHFDSPSGDLVKELIAGGEKKKPLLDEIERISNMANFYFARQKGPKGNITPLNNVKAMLGDEPFIYTFADDFFDCPNKPSMTQQLIDTYYKYNSSVLACSRIRNDSDYTKWGIPSGKELAPGEIDIERIIEKPGKENAPSNIGSVSGMLFTGEALGYFDAALQVQQEENFAEFVYTHLTTAMIRDGKKVIAKEIDGEYVDTGDKADWLKAQIRYAVRDPKIAESFVPFLKDFASSL